jgi:hypothetical protein
MGLRSRFADNEADGGFMEAIQWIGAGVLFFLVGGFIVFAFRQGMKVRPRGDGGRAEGPSVGTPTGIERLIQANFGRLTNRCAVDEASAFASCGQASHNALGGYVPEADLGIGAPSRVATSGKI